ncbi:MAG: response regulator [Gemmataceae bacterium]|nr:response regulator [Gemmataceae bacterium]
MTAKPLPTDEENRLNALYGLEPLDLPPAERFDRLFNLSLEVLCICGYDGFFKRLNPAWETTFGWTRAELMAEPFLNFIHPDDRAPTVAEIERIATGGITRSFEIRGRRRDGEYLWMLWNARAIPGEALFYATGRDITERKRAEEDRDRFFTLSLDMLCIADFQGYFRRLNPAWQQTLGWELAELTYKPFLEFVHPDDRAATVHEMQHLLDGNNTISFENRYRCRDGSYKWMLWSAIPFADQGLIYATARDITYRKRAEEELRTAKDAAEAASRSKSEFLAKMSHELRTPLNSVIGFANILLKNKGQNQREQDLTYLSRILANGKHLLTLINDVLDLAKVEAGRMEVELAPVSLAALVAEVLSQLEGQVRQRDLQLLSRLPPDVEPILTDPGKLKQVLINLVGNALKFTETGSVTVQVETEADGRRPVCIDVIDTGIGIPPERQQAVFQAFQQADNTTTRKYGGTGLGLAISRSLCQLLNYELDVSSAVGRGSTFRVWLKPRQTRLIPPQVKAQLVAAATDAGPHPPILGSGKRVLVIDDQSDSRILLVHYLEDLGCRVMTAASGMEGLKLAQTHRPDLITLDLMMPSMDGWEVLKQLKADPHLQDVPVVVVSIVASENRGVLLGAVDLLDKPLTRDKLADVLRRTPRPCGGNVLVVEDDADCREILTTQLADLGCTIRAATNGREALEALNGFTPDLVILDLMMPVMGGMEFLEALRRDARYLQLPVVVLTAKELTAQEQQQLNLSACDVLRKGDEIGATLQRLVRDLAPSA